MFTDYAGRHPASARRDELAGLSAGQSRVSLAARHFRSGRSAKTTSGAGGGDIDPQTRLGRGVDDLRRRFGNYEDLAGLACRRAAVSCAILAERDAVAVFAPDEEDDEVSVSSSAVAVEPRVHEELGTSTQLPGI